MMSCLGEWGGVVLPLLGLTARLPDQLSEGSSGFLDSVRACVWVLGTLGRRLPPPGTPSCLHLL